MNQHLTGTRERLEQSGLYVCFLFPFLAALGKYTETIKEESSFLRFVPLHQPRGRMNKHC